MQTDSALLESPTTETNEETPQTEESEVTGLAGDEVEGVPDAGGEGAETEPQPESDPYAAQLSELTELLKQPVRGEQSQETQATQTQQTVQTETAEGPDGVDKWLGDQFGDSAPEVSKAISARIERVATAMAKKIASEQIGMLVKELLPRIGHIDKSIDREREQGAATIVNKHLDQMAKANPAMKPLLQAEARKKVLGKARELAQAFDARGIKKTEAEIIRSAASLVQIELNAGQRKANPALGSLATSAGQAVGTKPGPKASAAAERARNEALMRQWAAAR